LVRHLSRQTCLRKAAFDVVFQRAGSMEGCSSRVSQLRISSRTWRSPESDAYICIGHPTLQQCTLIIDRLQTLFSRYFSLPTEQLIAPKTHCYRSLRVAQNPRDQTPTHSASVCFAGLKATHLVSGSSRRRFAPIRRWWAGHCRGECPHPRGSSRQHRQSGCEAGKKASASDCAQG
jgi:hypothetical protein